MGSERVEIGLAQAEETEELTDGTKVRVRRVEGTVTDRSINGTAYHEACHAVAAILLGIPVYAATDQPSADYGGATWVAGYDRRVAAAAEAKGCAGTGHDMWTIAMMGDSPSGAVAEAAILLSGQESQLRAVATIIQRAGMASGQQLHDANKRTTVDLVEVRTENPDGTTDTETRVAHDNVIDIPVEY